MNQPFATAQDDPFGPYHCKACDKLFATYDELARHYIACGDLPPSKAPVPSNGVSLAETLSTMRYELEQFATGASLTDGQRKRLREIARGEVRDGALRRLPGETSQLQWALDRGGELADWINRARPVVTELMAAYERRIRTDCLPADIERQPWRCAEYIGAESLLRDQPKAVVEITAEKTSGEPPFELPFHHDLCDAEDIEDCHGYEWVEGGQRGKCPCKCHAESESENG